jgi:hypothetical protein
VKPFLLIFPHHQDCIIFDEKETKEDRSVDNLPAFDNDLFTDKSTSKYNRGVLGGK